MRTTALNGDLLIVLLRAIKEEYGVKPALTVELNSLLGFRISDFLSITIEQGRQAVSTGRLVVEEAKTGKKRVCKIGGRSHGLIKRLLTMTCYDDHYLFESSRTRRPITRQTVHYWLKHAENCIKDSNEKRGIIGHINIASHSLRKTAARLLMKAGLHISKISKFLNHSNINTTMTYLDIGQDDVDECFDLLNAAIEGGGGVYAY